MASDADLNDAHNLSVLVAGAGALGNELLKNLALLGVARLTVIDEDRVEAGNLWKSVLFRQADIGERKAAVAARAVRDMAPACAVSAIVGSLQKVLGLGALRQHDVVLGALDNRAARVWLNDACARVQVPWIDAGLEPLAGIVRGFRPPHYACYRCTMSEVDWEQLAVTVSCTRSAGQPSLPTSPLSAAAIGAMQVRAALQVAAGDRRWLGRGVHLDLERMATLPIAYPIAPECPLHAAPPRLTDANLSGSAPLAELWQRATRELDGEPELLRLSRDSAAGERVIAATSALLSQSPRALGMPADDIVWARRGSTEIGLILRD